MSRTMRTRSGALIMFLSGVVSAAVISVTTQAADRPATLGSGLVERAGARLIQTAVSVVNPRVSRYQTVPGLTLDKFDIRLDGAKLSPAQRAKITFDSLCGPEPSLGRRVIVLIDLNYLDERARLSVSHSLEELSRTAADRPELYKFYALTRQLRALNASFTNDPAAIQSVASMIRLDPLAPRDAEPRPRERDIKSEGPVKATPPQKERLWAASEMRRLANAGGFCSG
jgi:hypothetical protein